MSAFFVSRQTIHDTVAAWCICHPMPRSTATLDSIGRQLWALNAEALRQRYRLDTTGPENAAELAEYLRDAAAYAYHPPCNASPAQLAKSANCLSYQCCEGDLPETSELYRALDLLCKAMGKPAGYDAAQWDRGSDVAA